MTRAGSGCALILAALALFLQACRQAPVAGEDSGLSLPAGAPDKSSDDSITLVPPGYERAAAGLSHLFHVAGDVFGAVDPIDGDILFLSGRGEQIGAARLPDGFDVRDIDIASTIVLRGDTAAVVIPRSGAVPAMLQSVPLPDASTSVTRNIRALQLTYRADNLSAVLSVAPLGPGQVLAVTFLGFDRAGNPFVYWEEGSGRRVDAWAGRFDHNGWLRAAVKLDFSEFADVPAVPVAVTPAGTMLMLHPKEESVDLLELTLVEGRAGETGGEYVATPPVRVLDVGEAEIGEGHSPYRAEPVRRAPPALNAEFAAATLARAREFLDVRWTLTPANFQQAGIEHDCEPEQGRYWTRPALLTEDKIGETVGSVPYKWGGFDSAERFEQLVAASRPALAGDVCACREQRFNGCLVARAAGIDCSGFVSRAWGLKAHAGTTQLASLAMQLPSLLELRPGDILNRPAYHVRLFVRFEPGAEVRLRTLESAVSCGGVCERVYTPAQLQSYRPMRMRRL